MGDLADAYAACSRMARDHYENFPVASRLLPAAMRPHVAAVYAFARVADDFADEGRRTVEERLALLDAWHERLSDAVGHRPPTAITAGRPPVHGTDDRRSPARGTEDQDDVRAPRFRPAAALPPETSAIFTAVAATIGECRLPVSLFEDLLSAFRQDVTVTRYQTWDDLLDYCRRSANPVGRLVLGIAGYRDDRLDRSSDALCTALQLTNFWQNLERDWQQGRLYLPMEDCEREGADTSDLDRGRMTPAWQRVLRLSAARTRELFDRGRPVCDGVHGRLRLELRLTWLGARRILSRIEEARFDVFRHRPTLCAADLPRTAWKALTWRAT